MLSKMSITSAWTTTADAARKTIIETRIVDDAIAARVMQNQQHFSLLVILSSRSHVFYDGYYETYRGLFQVI